MKEEEQLSVTMSEIESLFRQHAACLRRIVRTDVQTSDAVIEDACQSAWSSLLCHRDRVRGDGALAWLVRTAAREALRAVRREARYMPLEDLVGEADTTAFPSHDVFELRERLTLLHALPVRQQRLLWLHAAGLNYAEMAGQENVTVRTIERQLLRGKRAVRALAA